jgi:signal peptidase I
MRVRKRRIWPWIVCGALALLVLVRLTLLGFYRIPAGSMIPLLHKGDHIITNLRARQPKRGDVIVFQYPKDPDKDFVKRVIGVGGDVVEIRRGQVWLNGEPLPYEPRRDPSSYDDQDETGQTTKYTCRAFAETLGGHQYTVLHTHEDERNFPAVKVPADQYYVLGDNRDNSHDSRYWGFVPHDLVRGTLVWVWYSSGR